MRFKLRFILFIAGWLSFWVVTQAQPLLKQVEKAAPTERIRLVLNYFDTCQVVLKSQTLALRALAELDQLSQRQHDSQLQRYVGMLRDTYGKNDQTISHTQRAELFLRVAERAVSRDDEQIAGVCEHFAGQYYYLAQDYGLAFEYLLSANNRFQRLGYSRMPEIHRYLYELAFNYYYLNEDEKVIRLLTEATHYPPFSPNLHIQTYNTLAMAYARQSDNSPKAGSEALQNYQRAYNLAVSYRDSVWIGIINGNLGGLYLKQKRWPEALSALRVDYQLVKRDAKRFGYPLSAAAAMAYVYYEMGQLDSCRFYLRDAWQMHRLNTLTSDYSQGLQDDLFWQRYYNAAWLYYRAIGKLTESEQAADSLQKYEARIDKRYRSKAALLAEQRLLVEQHQAEVEALRQAARIQGLLLSLGGGIAIGIAIWLGLLYRSSQHRRRQEAITNAEREKRLEQENQQVTQDRDRARADLSVFLENLRQAESKNDLTDARLLTPDDWNEFRRRFERVHPLFFEQLRTQFADLTPAEERLMALSKLRIDTYRMGQMLGISPSSVRTTKYRLRKRLGKGGQLLLSELLD